MARLARLVVPGCPHHITQRGNRKQKTFFSDQDYEAYIDLIADACQHHKVDIWAYCLMPNHIHLIAVPDSEDGLKKAIGEAHRRYTRRINFSKDWRGYLWQGRFASCAMDDAHLLIGARYIELNPVRAGLAQDPQDYPWSSARAHIAQKDDRLVKSSALLGLVGNWRQFLDEGISETHLTKMRSHQRTGRPLGSEEFIAQLEEISGRSLRRQKPGPKRKASDN